MLKNNEITMSNFIITKQLTRAPSEYNNPETFPHVVIANRMIREQTKTISELTNSYIPYIICEGESKQYAQRAYHPEEIVKANGTLKVDHDWYLSQQIYPPISRLIEHIEGIDGRFICECFGLDAKKHTGMVSINSAENKEEENYQQKFLDVAKNKDNLDKYIGLTKYKLTTRMPGDSKSEYESFPGIIHARGKNFDEYLSGLVDKKTRKQLPEAYIKNRIKLLIKEMMRDYYEGRYVCCEESCKQETKTLYESNKCIISDCNSKLKAVKVNEKGVADTFNYLERLFDTETKKKSAKEQTELINEAIFDHVKHYKRIKEKVKLIRQNNAYDKINLDQVFNFMEQYNDGN